MEDCIVKLSEDVDESFEICTYFFKAFKRLLAIYPDASADWLEANGGKISKHALVIDCCGTKPRVCSRCFPVAEKFGFTYVGGHPMAGSHNSGFKYSRSNLFQGAPMVLVPPVFDDIQLLQRVKDVLAPCKFGAFSVTTAEEHDKMIAFTSQMPHIISNAFIKSPTALKHTGFSAGSYRDLTRVSKLNEKMWTELFFENKDNLCSEIDFLVERLQEYSAALKANDKEALVELLKEGTDSKKQAK